GDTAGAVFFPGGELVGGHDLVGGDFEIFVGIGGELGEVVRGFVVNVGAPEPSHGSDVDDAGNGANLVAIIDGKKIGERDLMTSDDAQRGGGGSLVDVEAAPDAEHDAEQEERKGDAGNRQQTAPLVAKCGLGDEAGESHGDNNILQRAFWVETVLALLALRRGRDAASRVSTGIQMLRST